MNYKGGVCVRKTVYENTYTREKGSMLRDQKWSKHRAAVERWKSRNREYYLAQKRFLAARPEYLALRRERYRAKKEQLRSCAGQQDLSAMINYLVDESETGDEEFRGPSDQRGTGATSTQGRNWTGSGFGTESQAAV